MMRERIAAGVGDGLRQAIIEALVRLNIGVIGEEIYLIAVIEFDAGIEERLDAVGRRRPPLLYRTGVMRQLRRQVGIGCGESEGRRTRRVADGLFVSCPLRADVDEALAAQGQAEIRR